MPSSWQSLGELLAGGGNLDKELALQNATTQNAYRSAQTNQALSDAKLNQEKTLTEAANRAAAERIRAQNAEALRSGQGMGDIVAGNFGNSFQAAVAGHGAVQEQGFQKTLGDALAPAADRLAASSALKEQVQGPLQTLGANTYYDVTQPNPEAKTTQVGESVIDRNQRGPVVKTPEQIRAEAEARATGTGMAKRTLDYPQAKLRMASVDEKFDRMTSAVDRVANDEALWAAVGFGKPLSQISGTAAARVRAFLTTLQSQIGFAVLQDMRDSSKTGGALGNISDRENMYLQNNLAAITSDLAPEDLREQLKLVSEYARGAKTRLRQAFDETYPTGGPSAPGAPAAPAAATSPDGGWTTLPDGRRIREIK